MMGYPQHQLGQTAELNACRYLIAQGLELIETNYRCKLGELDLIMRDRQQIVFVEVRARKSKRHGTSLETITASKQAKLIRAACYYLQTKNLLETISCRFDVIAFDGQTQQPEWIQNAFSADEF